mmetsp:Transcript_44373/g.84861  ORF Transcript_44373/g.84861 Transcript_44373/m.84861 type:complete len:299 (-) Transcript_44373:187-1083(-)
MSYGKSYINQLGYLTTNCCSLLSARETVACNRLPTRRDQLLPWSLSVFSRSSSSAARLLVRNFRPQGDLPVAHRTHLNFSRSLWPAVASGPAVDKGLRRVAKSVLLKQHLCDARHIAWADSFRGVHSTAVSQNKQHPDFGAVAGKSAKKYKAATKRSADPSKPRVAQGHGNGRHQPITGKRARPMTPVEMTLALALRGGGVASSSAAMTGHYTLNEVSSEPMPTLASGSLKDVVNNAKQRWFHEALELAQSGDCRQMALLAEMLAEGYGCEKDPTAAKYWTEQAKKGRAYRDGVYCTI